MNQPRQSVQHPVTVDMPLPGNYPCLTAQLNITRYAAQGLGRFVMTVREPTLGIEVNREFMDTDTWPAIHQCVLIAVAQCLANMRFLQDGHARD